MPLYYKLELSSHTKEQLGLSLGVQEFGTFVQGGLSHARVREDGDGIYITHHGDDLTDSDRRYLSNLGTLTPMGP